MKIGIKFFGVHSGTSFEMFEILDVGMNVGELYPFVYPDLLRTFEVVDKSALSDNSLDVSGITIEELKTYFETMGYPIKQVVGTPLHYLRFGFELQSGDLILVISECGTKAMANKFSTCYNNLKKIGFDKKVIKEIKYHNYFEKNCKVHHISCSKEAESISIMHNYEDRDLTTKVEFAEKRYFGGRRNVK